MIEEVEDRFLFIKNKEGEASGRFGFDPYGGVKSVRGRVLDA
ncbi:MAG: hypothetical protein QXK94_06200 [Candidatus Jordarchaeales archaeon]